MPLFRFYAESDNFTHVQIEHGAIIIPSPDLVCIVTVFITVSKERFKDATCAKSSQFGTVHQHGRRDEDIVEKFGAD